jgi:N-acetylneuraminic acid mutarotase
MSRHAASNPVCRAMSTGRGRRKCRVADPATEVQGLLLVALATLAVLLSTPSAAQDSWTATSLTGVPTASSGHAAVWTGSRMIVWATGGWPTGAGGLFDPASNTWTGATSMTGAPTVRSIYTTVWTGSRMIVWGGLEYSGSSHVSSTGGAYNPSTDTWTATQTLGAPEPRWFHTAVSTGSRMIVWGGADGGLSTYFNTGGTYDPATGTWTATTTSGAPTARAGHVAAWTGSRMIVWGGWDSATGFTTGALYDPGADAWAPTTTVGAPTARGDSVAVWAGSKMIVWGGGGEAGECNTGGIYDPETDSWTAMTTVGAPSPRIQARAVWTGSRMIVWGGLYKSGGTYVALDTGGIYDPAADTWTATTTAGGPGPRYRHSAIWTGSKMVVWGGDDYTSGSFDTGGMYDNPAVLPPPPPPTDFFTVTPCRLVDTRNAVGAGGAPALSPGATRSFPVTGGACGIPSTAVAVSVNVTAVGAAAAGYLTLFRGDGPVPLPGTIHFAPGMTRANNAIVLLATDSTGTINVYNGSTKAVHFVLDVNGYFQ